MTLLVVYTKFFVHYHFTLLSVFYWHQCSHNSFMAGHNITGKQGQCKLVRRLIGTLLGWLVCLWTRLIKGPRCNAGIKFQWRQGQKLHPHHAQTTEECTSVFYANLTNQLRSLECKYLTKFFPFRYKNSYIAPSWHGHRPCDDGFTLRPTY